MSYHALPDFLAMGRSANQTSNLAIGDHIEFDQFAGEGSRIVLATGVGQANGIVTLLAGARYWIEIGVLASFGGVSGAALATWTLRDSPGASNIILDSGRLAEVIVGPKSSTTSLSDHAQTRGVFTPGVDTDVVVDHTVAGGTFTFNNWRDRCFLNIQAFHVTGRPV